ncbi:MAG: preprotein translocase subunit SecA [Bacteroidales bacterium]|jgi:preprotein translocase subunit SecA|nr:preprotein translocase subunit SecA [Bacteroidales bacterium]
MSFINSVLSSLFGNKSDKDMREIQPYVEKVKTEYDRIVLLSNDQLRAETVRLKTQLQASVQEEEAEIAKLKEQAEDLDASVEEVEKLYKEIDRLEKSVTETLEETLNEILPAAFAVIKETARRFKENERVEVTANDFDRALAMKKNHICIEGDKAVYLNRWMAGGNEIVWDMVHYDVQLIGGVALHQGKIAEMATGEGKTLVATLPVFLNALSGRGVHVVTVNDYLSKRDSEWMGPLYEFHGLSVDCIDKHQPNSPERRNAYNSDITFGTNNEFGFDYLRDNMAISPEDLVQRKHHYSIVDEVDSVLIDDARTPLIIAGPVPRGDNQLFDEYKPRVEQLFNEQRRLVTQILTEAKNLINSEDSKERDKGGLLLLRAFKGLPKSKPLIKLLSEQGNKLLLQKTENFYMQNNNEHMHVVTDELFFVIDEKHNSIELTDKGIEILTRRTEDPDFFILPDIGTAVSELEKQELAAEAKIEKKDELLRDYAIKSERVHTVNQLLKAYTLFERDDEYVVIDNKVKIVDEQTGRIMEGRRYSDGLHQAIEAKESVKVEAATQTFATITLQNYFRMYHKLAGMTGTAETEAGELWNIYKLDVVVIPTNKPVIRKDHEDLVYKTKREKYNAVIEEIVDLINKGRPVLVGTTSVEISELLSKMLNFRKIRHNVLNAKLHQREADIVAEAGKTGTVTIATNMAGRGTDIKLSAEVKQAGGLAIVGTERHESRRVDRQLRGRAGRQGDPGSSQFFVSLEDDLMRLFGSDRIAGMMDRLGLKEGEMIQHSMITRSIERAQRKVEENNFGIRKRLLEYDDVMNSQREVIYTKRRHALYGERLNIDISNMMYDVIESLAIGFHEERNFEGLNMELIRYFSIEMPVDEATFLKDPVNETIERIYETALKSYQRKREHNAQQAMPVIADVFENQGGQYENIVVPFTDGRRIYQVITNLKKSYDTQGRELMRSFEKSAILATIDEAWKEHLRELDDLRQSVQNASYEQKDPLLIYKFESFELFKTMIGKVNRDVVSLLLKSSIPIRDPNEVQRAQTPRRLDMSRMQAHKSDYSRSSRQPAPGMEDTREKQKPQPLVKTERKVGRNDPCPCGSGKKYKNCHGANVPGANA